MVELAELSRELLPKMWDSKTRLFSHRTRLGSRGTYVNEQANALYSAIALVGLLEDGSADGPRRLLVENTLDALHSVHDDGAPCALGACLMWASALAGDSRTGGVLTRTTGRLSPTSDVEHGTGSSSLWPGEMPRSTSPNSGIGLPRRYPGYAMSFCGASAGPGTSFRTWVGEPAPVKAGWRASRARSMPFTAWPSSRVSWRDRYDPNVRWRPNSSLINKARKVSGGGNTRPCRVARWRAIRSSRCIKTRWRSWRLARCTTSLTRPTTHLSGSACGGCSATTSSASHWSIGSRT